MFRRTALRRVPVTAAAVPPSSGNPTPGVGDTLILDTRAGGAHDIQVATSWATAHAIMKAAGNTGYAQPLEPRAIDSGYGDNAFGWNFVTNYDGAGTHAFRSDMIGWGDQPSLSYSKDDVNSVFDGGNKMTLYLPTPLPTELYIGMKCWSGRTASGGGFNDATMSGGIDRSSVVGRFAQVNEEVGQGRASGRKWILLPRGSVGGGGCGRYDLIWNTDIPNDTTGTGTVSVSGATATFSSSQSSLAGRVIRIPGQRHQLLKVVSGSGTSWTIEPLREASIPVTITSEAFVITDLRKSNLQVNSNVTGDSYCNVGSGMPQSDNVRGQSAGSTTFRMVDSVNTVLDFVARIKVATTMGGSDGIVEIWCNGERIVNATDINYGNYPIDRVEFMGCTFRSPRFTQTEYFWDMMMWKP